MILDTILTVLVWIVFGIIAHGTLALWIDDFKKDIALKVKKSDESLL